MKLNIITPCTRPENIDVISASILSAIKMADHLKPITYTWHIIAANYDVLDAIPEQYKNKEPAISVSHYYGNDNPVAGKAAINQALRYIPHDEFCYVLDDDTVMHPDMLYMFVRALFITHPDRLFHMYTFDQYRGMGILKGRTPKVCHIDQAQYIWLHIGDMFPLDYCGDGLFAEALATKTHGNILYIEKPLCYYNWLKRDE